MPLAAFSLFIITPRPLRRLIWIKRNKHARAGSRPPIIVAALPRPRTKFGIRNALFGLRVEERHGKRVLRLACRRTASDTGYQRNVAPTRIVQSSSA